MRRSAEAPNSNLLSRRDEPWQSGGLSRPRRMEPHIVKPAARTAGNAPLRETLRPGQAVFLPAWFGATLEQTVRARGVRRAPGPRLQAAFRKPQSASPARPRNWGGRRQFLLTGEEAAAFLKPWLASAAAGNLAVVAPRRAARAQRLGRAVKPAVVYRLRARPGWCQVAPDTRHPKSQPEVLEAW